MLAGLGMQASDVTISATHPARASPAPATATAATAAAAGGPFPALPPLQPTVALPQGLLTSSGLAWADGGDGLVPPPSTLPIRSSSELWAALGAVASPPQPVNASIWGPWLPGAAQRPVLLLLMASVSLAAGGGGGGDSSSGNCSADGSGVASAAPVAPSLDVWLSPGLTPSAPQTSLDLGCRVGAVDLSNTSFTLQGVAVTGAAPAARWPSPRLASCLDALMWVALPGAAGRTTGRAAPYVTLVNVTIGVSPEELYVWGRCGAFVGTGALVQAAAGASTASNGSSSAAAAAAGAALPPPPPPLSPGASTDSVASSREAQLRSSCTGLKLGQLQVCRPRLTCAAMLRSCVGYTCGHLM